MRGGGNYEEVCDLEPWTLVAYTLDVYAEVVVEPDGGDHRVVPLEVETECAAAELAAAVACAYVAVVAVAFVASEWVEVAEHR